MTKLSHPGSLPHLAGRRFLAGSSTSLPSGSTGNFTQWALHDVQEHPNRSSNEGDMTFRSWRSCVVNFDEHCSWTLFDDPSWTTPIERPLFMTLFDNPSWTTPIERPLFMTLFDDHCSWPLFDDPSWTTPIGRQLFMTTV